MCTLATFIVPEFPCNVGKPSVAPLVMELEHVVYAFVCIVMLHENKESVMDYINE